MPDLFDHSPPRWPKPNTSVIFCDESSQTEHFCVYGGLYFWWPSSDYKNQIETFEREMGEIKKRYGLNTVKWEYVPKPSLKLEGHKALVRYLADHKDRIKFKCMVVDTKAYPLGHPTINDGDELVGYMKYYCVFLADGLMLAQKGYFYDITIDDYSWRPKTGHDSQRLGKTVEGRYRNNFQPLDRTLDPRRFQHSELKTANDEDRNFLQMVDLLAGAVAFCRNGGLDRTSNTSIGRKELVAVIRECYGGVRLDKQQQPRGPFVIWEFVDRKDGGRSLTAKGEVRYFP